MINHPKKNGRIKASELKTLSKLDLKKNIADYIQHNANFNSRLYAFKTLIHGNRRSDINDISESLINFIQDSLESGECVRLRGLGCLSLFQRKERGGVRNPKTGEKAIVEAKTIVKLQKTRSDRNLREIGITEVSEKVSEMHPGYSPKDVLEVYKALISQITKVGDGKTRIELRKLGVFSPFYVAPRNNRNPKTGEKIKGEEKIIVHFKCSDKLIEKLNS